MRTKRHFWEAAVLTLFSLAAGPAAAQTCGEPGVIPNDPYMEKYTPSCVEKAPEEYQWGHYALRIPEAWSLVKGHANVAVLDIGTTVAHPDLREQDSMGAQPWVGNLRLPLSYDFRGPTSPSNEEDSCPDEMEPHGTVTSTLPCLFTIPSPPPLVGQDPWDGPNFTSAAGHGTHVSGLVAAKPNNEVGVAGVCWNCSEELVRLNTVTADLVPGMHWALDRGSQVASMSLHITFTPFMPCPTSGPPSLPAEQFDCALEALHDRDVVVVASAGNGNYRQVDYPARDGRVIGAGGLQQDGIPGLFNPWKAAGQPVDCNPTILGGELGSNCGPELDLLAPAKSVLSTTAYGRDWSAQSACGDSFGPGTTQDGYGLCTGTSMSAPYVAGVAALVRSANPLLSKNAVYDILTWTASSATVHTDSAGYGYPDARAAAAEALGVADGKQLSNRLTPLFSLKYVDETDGAYLLTSVPQVAAAALDGRLYTNCKEVDRSNCPAQPFTVGGTRAARRYWQFPGFPAQAPQPEAGLYLFTTDNAPSGWTHGLVPLYRLTKTQFDLNGDLVDRSSAYASTQAELALLEGPCPGPAGATERCGYELSAIEGYIYPACAGCAAPQGAQAIKRRFHLTHHDFVVFPPFEEDRLAGEGYTAVVTGLPEVIGYAYPNADQDLDGLINGFEILIGTRWSSTATDQDTDGDGISDGQEVLDYPYTDPHLDVLLNASCTCTAGLSCSFSATLSGNVIGFPQFEWLVDKDEFSSATANVTFPAAGSYRARVIATGSFGTLERRCTVTAVP